MIKSAAVRLALWYLAIIMVLSVGFSLFVYHLSDRELTAGLRRPSFISSRMVSLPQYERFRDARLLEAHSELRVALVFFNVLVLLAGGLISYGLARRTLEPIEAALQRQSRFTADASHELRTPLTAMQTEIEVALRNKNLNPNQAKALLASNLEEVNKLRALSDVLLRLARHDDQALNLQTISLLAIGTSAVKSHSKAAKAKKITIDNRLDDALVVGDQAALTEILSILLDNALKYSPAGSQINLTNRVTKHQVQIDVSDQGQGIATADIRHIFDRFYRQDSSRTNGQVGGYGLGLSIAKQLVTLHQGTLSVKSLPGVGSTFTVSLPKQA
ncbi:MAG: HAMP domain-containing sensor histidine kinase [Candidatus Saccharimonadales bacterium]